MFILESEPKPPRYPASKQVSFSTEVSQIPRGSNPSVSSVESVESAPHSREGTPLSPLWVTGSESSSRESSEEPLSPSGRGRGPKPAKPPKPAHLRSMIALGVYCLTVPIYILAAMSASLLFLSCALQVLTGHGLVPNCTARRRCSTNPWGPGRPTSLLGDWRST